MYMFRANRAVTGIRTTKAMIMAMKDCPKLRPMKTFEMINAATPMATVSP